VRQFKHSSCLPPRLRQPPLASGERLWEPVAAESTRTSRGQGAAVCSSCSARRRTTSPHPGI